MTEWHTGIPPVVDIDEDNEYCYAICIWYDGWWLIDYLFKANYEEGCFESAPKGDEKPLKWKFGEDNPPFHTTLRWHRIIPYGD